MYTSGLSGVDPSSSAWNAIASIKSTSPFDTGSSTSDVAGEFDSLIDTSQTDALGAASAAGAGAASASAASSTGSGANLALLRQLQNAEQSTVDLYA